MLEQNTTFSIVRLKEISFSFNEPIDIIKAFKNDPEKKMHDYLEAGLDLSYRWNLSKNSFSILIDFMYIFSDDSRKVELMNYTFVTDFLVTNLSDIFIDKGNGQFEMDLNFEKIFVGLAISSGRGMIAVRLAGTYMGRFVYPIIDPSEVVLSNKSRPEIKID